MSAKVARRAVHRFSVLMSVALVWAAACSDGTGVTKPRVDSDGLPAIVGLMVSAPIASPAAPRQDHVSFGAASGDASVVYVSMAPSSAPTGRKATIRNVATGQSITVDLVNGGFDPAAIAASAGDTLFVTVTGTTADVLRAITVVAKRRPPVVVRTDPPPKKRDVPLNAAMVMVFSAPIDETTLTPETVQLWSGATRIPGTVRFTDDAHLRAEFQTDVALAGRTDYQLVMSQGIADVNGVALESVVTVPFTTVAVTIVEPWEEIVTAGLILIKTDGSGTVELGTGFSPSHGYGFSPSWSHDGSRLAFATTQCDTDWTTYITCYEGGIVIVNPETREFIAPPAGDRGFEPSWAPTGDRIVYHRDGRLFVMRLDGSAAEQIVLSGIMHAEWPAWSHDGRIAFRCYMGYGYSGICVVNADGSGLIRVTPFDIDALAPDWSPDGKRIAFQTSSGSTPRVAIVGDDGSGLSVLTDGFLPVWSRDGTRLGFWRENDGTYTIGADGTNLRRVNYGFGGGAVWRP